MTFLQEDIQMAKSTQKDVQNDQPLEKCKSVKNSDYKHGCNHRDVSNKCWGGCGKI
jgi:hypothetical protein